VASRRPGCRARGNGSVCSSVEQTIVAIRAVLDKVDPLLANAAELADRIARGEGSIGRLLQDPEFPEDTKDLGKIMKRQPWKIIARPHD